MGWLDAQLTLKERHDVRLKEARNGQNRLRRLVEQVGLSPENAGGLKQHVFQVAALFGSEIWWKGDGSHATNNLSNKRQDSPWGFSDDPPRSAQLGIRTPYSTGTTG